MIRPEIEGVRRGRWVFLAVALAACAAACVRGEDCRVARTLLPKSDGPCINPDFHTYRPFNDDYAVWLDGKRAEVRACRESRIPFNRVWPGRQRPLDQTERASYVAFEATGSVRVRIRPKRAFTNVVVRPLSAGVRASVSKGAAEFVLPRPGYYVCEVDGREKALQLFYEAPRDFPERDKATISYGPGFHLAGVVRLRDHDRVYVDRDAVVFGCFMGAGVKDVRIFGHGVIDGRSVERVFEGAYSELQPSCIRFHRSSGLEVDGPVLLDSPCWVLSLFDCEDVRISHVKIAGQWRYNTDGIDICNSRRVRVSDCYIRSFDDGLVIKGVPPYADRPVEDVIAERCVLWCGWGKTVEPGIETWASRFRNIRVSDCDLIHSAHAGLNISAGGTTVVEDVLFENLRVELQLTRPQVYQKTDAMRYEPAVPFGVPNLLLVGNRHLRFPGACEDLAHVRNVTVRKVDVALEDGCGKPRIRVLAAADGNGQVRPFENIRFEGFSINGRPADWSQFDVVTNTPVALLP